jgi:hypothetical protein
MQTSATRRLRGGRASETIDTCLSARAPSPVDPLDELICVVDEAQERDAEDERRLYRRLMSGSRRMRRGSATDR